MTHNQGLLMASLALQLAPDPSGSPSGYNVQLFPEGAFSASDGRPGNMEGCQAKTWFMDATIAPAIIEDVDIRQARPVVDYDHQSIRARENGQPAPAAGWIQALAYFPGQGLFAKVEWTERARGLINSGEYRYISPLFEFDQVTGAVRRLVNAGLTNTPALDGLMAVAASQSFDGKAASVDLVRTAIAEGVLPKALEGWAMALGNEQPQQLRAFLDKIRPVVAASKKDCGAVALTADEQQVARLFGQTDAGFLEDKRRLVMLDNPTQVAALTVSEKQAAHLLGMTEAEYFARKEAL
ncbi:hypothetical protein JCM15519_35690 [Fundidesulfovibrio butyratiphilus]